MKPLSEITTGQELAEAIDAICKLPLIEKKKRTISKHGSVSFASKANDLRIDFGIYQWGASELPYLSIFISWQGVAIWDERFDSIEVGLSSLHGTLKKMSADAANTYLLFFDRRTANDLP